METKPETCKSNSLSSSAERKDTSYLDIETTTNTTTTACDESDSPRGSLADKTQIEFRIPDIHLYENMCSTKDDEGSSCMACMPSAGRPSSLFPGTEWFLAKETLSHTEDQPPTPHQRDDESVNSVNSVAYFEPTDFNRSTWESVMNAPTMGLAFVGIAMALTHPLLFVAGLLTAVGTATAASRGYDCLEKGMYSQIWESMFESSEAQSENQEKISTGIESDTPKVEEEEKRKKELASEKSDGSDDHNNIFADEHERNGLKKPSRTRRSPPLPPGIQSTTAALDQSRLPPDWMVSNFTELKHHVVIDRKFVGLNVLEFFGVFLGDDAPYSFKEFQKKRGDLDIVYGNWREEIAKGPLSLHPPSGAAEDFPFDSTSYLSYSTRTLKFKAKTNNSSLLGPAFATTTKVQRAFLISKRYAVIEMKTTLRDIPFADRFFVLERWVIRAEKDDSGKYTTFLSVSTGVVFTGSCPFESPIKTKSAAAVSDVINAWCTMASEALKLTEKNKKLRLDNIVDQEEDNDLPMEENQKFSCSDQEGSNLSVEMNIDSYLDTTNTFESPARSLKRTVSDPLDGAQRRTLLGLRRSISQILTRGKKDLPSKTSPQ